MSDLVLHPDDRLRVICQPVHDFKEAMHIADTLFEVMYFYKGLGLAAPQIGRTENIFVANVDGKERVFINVKHCEIFGDNPNVLFPEGCLSLPGITVNVSRPSRCVLEYTSLRGKKKKESFTGLLSRVCRHEIDHLAGKLIIDYDQRA